MVTGEGECEEHSEDGWDGLLCCGCCRRSACCTLLLLEEMFELGV
jgi:hypothetical protein